MDDLPQLLPLWHTVTLREALTKTIYHGCSKIFPDHGGVGIDISVNADSSLNCNELKTAVNETSLAPEYCALPFLPPNKVKSLSDPCIEVLKQQNKQQRDFCTRLENFKRAMKTNTHFRSSIFSTYKDLYQLCAEGKDAEISVPKSILSLAQIIPENFPVPRANWLYTGGCLAAIPYQHNNSDVLLLHPGGKKFNELVVTPMDESKGGSKIFKAHERRQQRVKLKGGIIYQIAAGSVSGNNCCFVRQKKTYHFITLDVNHKAKEIEICATETVKSRDHLSSIGMSPYVPGEYVIITEDGDLFLRNVESKETIWQLSEPLNHDPVNEDMWWGCDFGSHPRSVLYIDRINFSSLDLRSKNSKAVNILSSPNPFLIFDEQLMVTKRLTSSYFQHLVATDTHLFICDERYPQQPVMSWNHMLEKFPLYCDITCYNGNHGESEYVTLLGSQEPQEVASFYFQTFRNQVQPLSLSPPLHISIPTDSAMSLKLHGIPVDDRIMKRLSVPLIGVCAVPHYHHSGFTAFQLSSLGDVFYQEFLVADKKKEKSYRVGPGCILVPPETILPNLTWWFDLGIVDEKPKQYVWQLINKSEEFCAMMKQQNQAKDCSICRHKIQIKGEELIDSEECPSCGVDVELGKKLTKTMEEVGILSGPIKNSANSNCLNLIDVKLSQDLFSRKLLNEWMDTGYNDEMSSARSESSIDETEKSFSEGEILTSLLIPEGLPLAKREEKYFEEPAVSNAATIAPGVMVDDKIMGSISQDISEYSAAEVSSYFLPPVSSVTEASMSMNNASWYEDIVHPSQEPRELLGETLRTPGKRKVKQKSSLAGF